MGYFGIDVWGRNATDIVIRVGLYPDDTGYYKAVVKRDNIESTAQEWIPGYCEAQTNHSTLLQFSGMSSNTSYNFSGQLYVKWSADAEYTAGGATFSQSLMTYPNTPQYLSSTSQYSGSVTITWNQNLGGNASTIYNKIYIYANSSYSTPIDSTEWFTASSGTNTKTIDVSNYDPGTYFVRIVSRNLATDANDLDQPTDTYGYYLRDYSDGTFTVQAVTPAITGTWSSGPTATRTANANTVDYSATWTQTSSGSNSWRFEVYVYKSGNIGPSIYSQTATLSQNGYKTISGTTSALEPGTYYVRFYAIADGVDEYREVQVTIPPNEPAGTVTLTDAASTDSLHTLYYDAKFTCSSGTAAYYKPRIYYKKGSSVNSSSYDGMITADTAYSLSSSSPQRTWNMTIPNLDRDSQYALRAYMMTGTTSSNVTLNTNLYSTTKTAYTAYMAGNWTTSPTATQASSGTTCRLRGTFENLINLDQSVVSYIEVSENSSVIHTTSNVNIDDIGDTISVDFTTGSLDPGKHTFTFTPKFVDSGSALTYRKGTSSSQTAAVSITVDISGERPTGAWGTGNSAPKVSQTSGAQTATYSATVSRNDSVSSQYYVRIRVINEINSSVSAGNGTQIANSGSVTVNSVSSSALTAGSHTYTFVAEYRKTTSDSWMQMTDSSGNDLYKSVTFTISASTDETTPTGSWTTTPNVSQNPGEMKATYIAAIQRNDNVNESFYVRIRVVDSSDNSVYSNSGSRISKTGSVSLSRQTSTLTSSSYSYTFIPEWQNSSGTWVTLTGSGGASLTTTVPFTIVAQSAESLPLWSWTAGNVDTTLDDETSAAYTAITSHGEDGDFDYRVWNDLCDFVNQILTSSKVNLTWYGSINNVKMTSSDKVLTAVRFNNLVKNLNNIAAKAGTSSYGVTAATGSPVYGYYFTDITTRLNTAINALNA